MKTYFKEFIKDVILFEISSFCGWYSTNFLLSFSNYVDSNNLFKSLGANICCYITYHYTYE